MQCVNWRTKIGAAVLVAGLALGAAGAVQAQGTDALLDLLVRKGIITEKEMKGLKEEVDADMARAMARANKTKVNSWVDSLKWSGDVRLRSEFFDNEDRTGSSANDRWRFRYRLRLQLDAAMVEWAKATVRVASGSPDPSGSPTGTGDPLSTNQTLGDTFRNKPIYVDAVYVTLQPPGWDWVKIYGGKMDNVMWQPKFGSPMVYDGDMTPEGLAQALKYSFGEDQRWTVFGNFGQYAVKESSGRYSDSYLLDFQAGVSTWLMGPDAKKARLKLMGAVGYYQTMNVAGAQYSFLTEHGNRGNYSLNGTNHLADFQVLSARGEAVYQISDKPFFGTSSKVTLSGEYVTNLADAYNAVGGISPDQTEGWTAQVQFGDARKKGEWQLSYQYKHLEADAVWDGMTDSDWGYGGTDRKGHVIKAAYNLQDWWQLGAAAIISEKISGRTGSHDMTGDGTQMLRIQLDSAIKF